MSWKESYNIKKVSAAEAVKHIKSGNRVVLGHACGEPQAIIQAMVDNAELYEGVEIVHMVAMGKGEYAKPHMQKHFRHNGLFLGGATRDAVAEDRADYTPCFFFEVPRLFRQNILPVDVALIQVSEPDNNGNCSLGVSCDYTKAAAENARITIAQVNEMMPVTFGDCMVNIDEIDFIVEKAEPIIELKRPEIGNIEKKIGQYCASLIEDGSTLQLGIGGIPDAVLTFLKDKNDLGIHSEMFSDGVLDLFDSGNITNKKKTLHKDKFVATFMMGSKKLYDFIDNNPAVELYPVDYVNNPYVIAKNYNMVSINSAIQLDLMGQVAAESIGSKQFSGTGGQVDFVRGASYAPNGKSIIALPSTAAKGKISRIVPIIDEGSAVTTSRNDVHYIITEYGIADLRGKTLKERARALINISHPNFKDELIEQARKKFKNM